MEIDPEQGCSKYLIHQIQIIKVEGQNIQSIFSL